MFLSHETIMTEDALGTIFKNMKIDLNCDMGESFGNYNIGNDELVFSYITSCNVACGFHGGDPFHIEQTIQKALKNKIQIGAHPSYPDLQGFGRRAMKIQAKELKSIIKYQIAAVKGITESLGGILSYIKPHGALYNNIANDKEEAKVVINAIQEMDENLALMGLANSPLQAVAAAANIRFIAEAFADRQYTANGRLMPRSRANAVFSDPAQVAHQVLSIAKHQKVKAENDTIIPMPAQSICIHGDHPNLLETLNAIHQICEENEIELESFRL